MKTKRNIRGKIFFIMLSVTLLLLLASSVGMTLGKYTGKSIEHTFKEEFTIDADNLVDSDPASPDRPGIAEPPTDVYQVQDGDTLLSVAEKYHVSVDALAACNGLSPDTSDAPLPLGTVLHIPTEN